MKAFTDIEQSKKLAEILPIESADMCYRIVAYNPNDTHVYQPYCFVGTLESDIPCWSLAALLSVLDEPYLFKKFHTWSCYMFDPNNHRFISTDLAEPVDTCYEMILKLHEQKLL